MARVVRRRLLDIQTSEPDSQTIEIKPRFLSIAGASDEDGDGGWVAPVLQKNLELAIADKTAKIAPCRARYSEWWLILVDYIFGGRACKNVSVQHDFDKVIVIHPGVYAAAYEFPSTSRR